jgi:hypothetical protein
MTTEHIRHAALALAEAKVAAERAETALDAANAGRKRVADRISALSAERASIIGKARAGSNDPALSLQLGVVEADLGDLGDLVAGADAEVAKVQASVAEARQAVVRAEQQLASTRDSEIERLLVVHAGKLDELLLATVNELAAVGKRIGRARPMFAPSQALADSLYRLRLTANGIRQ